MGEGAWAPFFGRPAYTMTLVGRLRQASGAALIMTFGERLPAGAGYRVHYEEIASDPLDEPALNRAVEAQVRRRPEQYLWSYNRYKVPAGAQPPPESQAPGRKSQA
jgi:KDO2-lipid IV(A) lauroyltransferase